MSKNKKQFSTSKRQVVILLLAGLLIYALLSQLGGLHNSLRVMADSSRALLGLAVILTLSTYFFAALTYLFLALHPLRYARTVLVQFAAMSINRLVPSGVGALGANYLYLRHERHRSTEAATVIAVNNFVGFVGHALLVLTSVLLLGFDLPSVSPHFLRGRFVIVAAVLATVLAIGLLANQRLWIKVKRTSLDVLKQLGQYAMRPGQLASALGSSMLLTTANVLTLYVCVYAVGGQLSFVPVLLAFSVGIGLGAALPTPGGLGGVEAGIVAGLVAYQLPSHTAVAAVLLFRLISYWLTLFVGAGIFTVAQRRRYFG